MSREINCLGNRADEEEFIITEDGKKRLETKNSKQTPNKLQIKTAKQLGESFLKDKHMVFLFLSAFLQGVISQMIFSAIPIIIIENLHYFKSTVNVVMALQLLGFAIMLSILYFIKMERVMNGVIGWILNITSLATTIVISKHFSFTVNVVLLICILIFIEVSIIKIRVFVVTSLATFVDSRYQSFANSIRVQTSYIGIIVGSLVASSSAKYVKEYFGTFLVLITIFLFVTINKRNILGNNKIRV